MFTLANTTEHVWSSVYPFTLQKSIKITRGKASCAGCYLITAISQREQGLWGSFSSVQLCLTLPYLIEPALNKYITEATRLVGKNLINSSWFDSEQIYICSAGSVHSESVWKMLLCQVLPVLSVADLEIQKGGFSHWRAKRARKFLGCHAHFRHAGSPNRISRSNSRPHQMSEDQ